ncbi:ent-kaurene oxidase [Apiospora kogelbergensis]|uniref:Ent-kaurene oxidase n=1 Tax=Apiospora kogelbergensis TaxID=1337665 RepID=A0AAW0RE95_9PEZI
MLSDRVVSPGVTPKPAVAYLISLCEEYQSIVDKYQHDLGAADKHVRKRDTKKMIQDQAGSKNRKRNKFVELSTLSEVEKMESRLTSLQKRFMVAIFMCLWEDSKQTKNWEYEFGRMMNEIFSNLKRIEGSTTGSSPLWVDSHNPDRSLSTTGLGSAYSTAKVSQDTPNQVDDHNPIGSTRHHLPRGPSDGLFGYKTASVLVDIFSQMTASDATKLQDCFKQTLQTGSKVVEHIYPELTRRLWREDWQPDTSLAEGGTEPMLASAITGDLVESMTKGLCYETSSRDQHISSPFGSTYRWIFDRQPKKSPEGLPLWHSFPDWLEGTSDSVYWITGKPYSGKSTMMKYIAEATATPNYLQQWSDLLPVIVASYYAWNPGHSLQNSVEGLKRAVLHQAVSQQPKIISLISPRRWVLANALPYSQIFPDWDSWEVEESFNLLVKSCGQTFRLALFIDGLNEFDVDPGEVVRLIGDISISTGSLKICVASRPWNVFQDAYGKLPQLHMHDFTRDDIVTFVEDNLGRHPVFSKIQRVHYFEIQEIKKQIVDKSHGVFLWVSLAVRSLLESLTYRDSLHKLLTRLNSLPNDMFGLYDAIWEMTEPIYQRHASWMVLMVAAAQNPLGAFTLWLADESRGKRVDVTELPSNIRWSAPIILKRQLESQTGVSLN